MINFIVRCTATVVGSTRSPCQPLEEKRGARGLDLQGSVRDRLFAFVDFKAFGYHILMICVLSMLSSSCTLGTKGVLPICRSDSERDDLQAPLTFFFASGVAMPRYYFVLCQKSVGLRIISVLMANQWKGYFQTVMSEYILLSARS
jgi:hypothetical protein